MGECLEPVQVIYYCRHLYRALKLNPENTIVVEFV